jgi:hypothetical protein
VSDQPTLPAPVLPTPFAAAELRGVLRDPAQALEIVLAARPRLAASIAAVGRPWPLVAVLALCTTVASLPYGLVLGASAFWKVTVLFGGSVLLCFPSLQVFGAYLGSRLQPVQNLALSLVIASVAALFTLGFAPIAWFLTATMAQGDWIDAHDVSLVLLAAALVAGLGQLTRCVRLEAGLLPNRSSLAVLVAWQALVVFVTLRMARALGLLG